MTTIPRSRTTPTLVAVLLVGLLLAFSPGRPAVAEADATLEAEFLALLNEERATHGVAPLDASDEVTAAARDHSVTMADTAHLHHNPALDRAVAEWDRLGENVGRGTGVDAVHAALLRSPSHRANLLDPGWREAGIGVEVRDGVVWVTQVFRA